MQNGIVIFHKQAPLNSGSTIRQFTLLSGRKRRLILPQYVSALGSQCYRVEGKCWFAIRPGDGQAMPIEKRARSRFIIQHRTA